MKGKQLAQLYEGILLLTTRLHGNLLQVLFMEYQQWNSNFWNLLYFFTPNTNFIIISSILNKGDK